MFFLISGVTLIVLIRLELVIQTRSAANEIGDFAYFYTAAHAYFLGFGPYGADYKALLTELFPNYFPALYPAALFYPPQTLATYLPFAGIEAAVATEIFFRINALCLVLSVLLCWHWLSVYGYLAGRAVTALLLIPFAAGFADPAMSSLLHSNYSNILLLGFVLWAQGGAARRPGMLGAGLAILMLKPSLALPFLIISLVVSDYRRGAYVAIAITAVLYLIGSAYTDPITAFFQYMSALSEFASHPGNEPWNLVGLFAFLDPDVLRPSTFLSIGAACVAGLAAVVLGKGNAWKTGLVAMCLTLLLSPAHDYDMVMLIPALFLSVTRGPWVGRVVLFVGMAGIVLGPRLGLLGIDADLRFQTLLLLLVSAAVVTLSWRRVPL